MTTRDIKAPPAPDKSGFHSVPGLHFEVWTDYDDVNNKMVWFWWACLPGCMPDGECNGPFESSLAAYSDAIYSVE